jgi:hypothetical protein
MESPIIAKSADPFAVQRLLGHDHQIFISRLKASALMTHLIFYQE